MHHLIHIVIGLSAFFVLFFVLLLSIGAYFLPAIAAFLTRHPHKWIIAALNLFFGWSIIAWFVCAIWVGSDACFKSKRNPQYFG